MTRRSKMGKASDMGRARRQARQVKRETREVDYDAIMAELSDIMRGGNVPVMLGGESK